jgi:hypothetical protein
MAAGKTPHSKKMVGTLQCHADKGTQWLEAARAANVSVHDRPKVVS